MTTAEPTEAVTGVPFTLNGTELVAEEGELLIDACDRNGVHIPRFCYHNRMKPVGMCRMCLVEVDTGRGKALQPSCMLPVTPEMKVETESEATKKAQDGVLELLLANHPLDCPVCDKGGECPLQDNAYAFGPGETRFVEEKRHFKKPIPISDLVKLDRERCILCDRCTRFASDVAGDPLIHFIDRGSQTQVNTFPDHPFSSYFSGNTVQICPVGALTAEPYRFKARPWDLEAVESTATVDSTGARVVLQSSQNEIVRVLGVDSDAVNWSWLSDKERFSYEATAKGDRIEQPLVKNEETGMLEATRWNNAAKKVGAALRVEPDRIAAVGGARMPLEGQYAWAKLLKGVVGTDHVDAQLDDGLPGPLVLGLPRATINDACKPGGVVVTIGADLKEELPTLFLRLRHAVVEDGVKLIELTSTATHLSDFATVRFDVTPGSVGQLATAIAKQAGADLDFDVADESGLVEAQADKVAAAAALLDGSVPVTIIVGRGNLAESPRFTSDAVGIFRRLNDDFQFMPALRRGNINGALEMGLVPGFTPGGVQRESAQLDTWPDVPDFDGMDTKEIFRAAAEGRIDTLLLLAANPLQDFLDEDLVRQALANVKTVIAVDGISTETTDLADVVLPAALFGEVDGTFVNLEGRLSPLRAKVTPPSQARPDWMIPAELAIVLGVELGFTTIDELHSELSEVLPSFADIDWDTLGSSDDGPVLKLNRSWNIEFGKPAAAPPATSAFRLVATRKLWDQGTMVQESPSLASLPSEAAIHLNPDDIERHGFVGDSVTVRIGDQTHTIPLTSDVRVNPTTASIPVCLPGFDARTLITGRSTTAVEIRPNGTT